MAGVIYSLNEAVGRVFPERRLYIRSDARTQYWTLSPLSQTGLAVVFALAMGWTGLTTVAFLDAATDGRTAENRLAATKDAYEIQLAALREQQRLLEEELNRSNARGDAVTTELSAKQRLSGRHGNPACTLLRLNLQACGTNSRRSSLPAGPRAKKSIA